MPLLFQFRIDESWWVSFVRESFILQYREESNLLFQETAPHEICTTVQGRGGGSHPYQRARRTTECGDTKKIYRLATSLKRVTANEGLTYNKEIFKICKVASSHAPSSTQSSQGD